MGNGTNGPSNPTGMWDPAQLVNHWNNYDRSIFTGGSAHKGDKWLAYINRNIKDPSVRKDLYTRIFKLYNQRKAAGQQINKYDLRSIENAMKQKYSAAGLVPPYFDISGWSFDSTMAARLNTMISNMQNVPAPEPTKTVQSTQSTQSTKTVQNTQGTKTAQSTQNTQGTKTAQSTQGTQAAQGSYPKSKAGMPSDLTRLGNGPTAEQAAQGSYPKSKAGMPSDLTRLGNGPTAEQAAAANAERRALIKQAQESFPAADVGDDGRWGNRRVLPPKGGEVR